MHSKFASLFAVLPYLMVVQIHAADAAPLPFAHAHNDYLHQRPLLDALDNGFCSVEADVFLVDGKLLVAHTAHELSDDRTLQGLYLDPLRRRIKRNGGRVHRDGPTFTLLIDIKNRGVETWQELNRVLADYSEMVSRVEDGEFHEAAITAVVSGDRAFDVIAATSPRFAGIDGRVSDIGSDRPTHLMPLISDNWHLHFRWQGDGRFPQQGELNCTDWSDRRTRKIAESASGQLRIPQLSGMSSRKPVPT
jgi:hypothetical protein